MRTAADTLKTEPHQSPFTIAPTASVFEAVELMAERNVARLVRARSPRALGANFGFAAV
jgi:CBS domain-containing protein